MQGINHFWSIFYWLKFTSLAFSRGPCQLPILWWSNSTLYSQPAHLGHPIDPTAHQLMSALPSPCRTSGPPETPCSQIKHGPSLVCIPCKGHRVSPALSLISYFLSTCWQFWGAWLPERDSSIAWSWCKRFLLLLLRPSSLKGSPVSLAPSWAFPPHRPSWPVLSSATSLQPVIWNFESGGRLLFTISFPNFLCFLYFPFLFTGTHMLATPGE